MPLTELTPSNGTAVVRNLLDDINAALKGGATRRQVFDVLIAEHGLKLTYGSFEVALKRVRAERAEAQSGDGTGNHPHENITPADSADSRKENGDAKTGPKKSTKRPSAPMKSGDFGPPKEFDPSAYDKRYD